MKRMIKVLSILCLVAILAIPFISFRSQVDEARAGSNPTINSYVTLSKTSCLTTDTSEITVTLSFKDNNIILFSAGAKITWDKEVFDYVEGSYKMTDGWVDSVIETQVNDGIIVIQGSKYDLFYGDSSAIGSFRIKLKSKAAAESKLGASDSISSPITVSKTTLPSFVNNSTGNNVPDENLSYTSSAITINKPSSSCDLTNLTITSPAGIVVGNATNTDTATNKTATIPYATTSVTLNATKSTDASVQYKVGSGSYTTSSTISVSNKSTMTYSITIKVTAQNGSDFKEYTLLLTRTAAETINSLNTSALKVLNGSTELSGTWSGSVYTVSGTIPYADKSNIKVNATKTGTFSTMTINSMPANSGQVIALQGIAAGENTINIVVTSQHGVSSTYSIKFTVEAADNNATLDSLVLKDLEGNVLPFTLSFSPYSNDYVAYLDEGINAVAVFAEASVATSTITGLSNNIDLTNVELPYTISIKVTNQAGNETIYTINLSRAIKAEEGITNIYLVDANNEDIKYNVVGFDKNVYMYTILIPKGAKLENYKIKVDYAGEYSIGGAVDIVFTYDSTKAVTHDIYMISNQKVLDTYYIVVKEAEDEEQNPMVLYILMGTTGLMFIVAVSLMCSLIVNIKRLKMYKKAYGKIQVKTIISNEHFPTIDQYKQMDVNNADSQNNTTEKNKKETGNKTSAKTIDDMSKDKK